VGRKTYLRRGKECGRDTKVENEDENSYFLILPMAESISREDAHSRHSITGSEIYPGPQLLFCEILLSLCPKALLLIGS
jgi:hypothetical protein